MPTLIDRRQSTGLDEEQQGAANRGRNGGCRRQLPRRFQPRCGQKLEEVWLQALLWARGEHERRRLPHPPGCLKTENRRGEQNPPPPGGRLARLALLYGQPAVDGFPVKGNPSGFELPRQQLLAPSSTTSVWLERR